MNVIVNFGILLLLLIVLMAGIGAYKVKRKTVNYKTGSRHAKWSATLVTAVALWMTQSTKYLSGIETLNLGFFLLMLWAVAFYMVWGVMVFVLNKLSHAHDHEHSAMLSMLYVDSEHLADSTHLDAKTEPVALGRTRTDHAKLDAADGKKSWSD